MKLVDKLRERVNNLDLNLKDKVVLTEAGTGAYVVTPILAALAGAKVYAFAKATRHGTFDEVVHQTRKIINQFDCDKLDIEFINELSPDIISKADIITNSGHLRPLTEEKLKYAKDGIAIPLMYEAWEWRKEDLDINYIKKRNFKIAATNERHPDIDVFNYLGELAVKQLFDSGCCLYGNKFILLCNNDFGPYIAKTVSLLCDRLAVIDLAENKEKYAFKNIDWVSNYPDFVIPESYKDAEAIIFTGYPFDKTWIGENAPIQIDKIKTALSDPLIIRYAGDVDLEKLQKTGVRYYPEFVQSGHMGILPSEIGYDSTIRLQAGGLKVGEALLSGNYFHKNIPLLQMI